jgi:hypothetical protein
MIHHIVCLRFKPGTNPEQLTAAGAALMGMGAHIPEIQSVHWTENLGPSATEYSHVLTVVLKDMDAVARYLDHPHHQMVLTQYLGPIRDARLALDIQA